MNEQDIINLIKRVINEETIKVHYHNGIDSNSLNQVLPNTPQSAITGPSGGATIDSQARSSISTIISVLKNVGITL